MVVITGSLGTCSNLSTSGPSPTSTDIRWRNWSMYGWQVSSTHPTGMLSCLGSFSTLNHSVNHSLMLIQVTPPLELCNQIYSHCWHVILILTDWGKLTLFLISSLLVDQSGIASESAKGVDRKLNCNIFENNRIHGFAANSRSGLSNKKVRFWFRFEQRVQ